MGGLSRTFAAIPHPDGGPGERMRLTTKPEIEQEQEQEQALTLNRRLGDLRTIASNLKRSRMTPLQVCQSDHR
jgi:hypothetical protein